ncbi:MAG: hypothetical protein NTW55_04965 [Planctomycetota bacterium]|nr:hypothetical protein [Planctomycetota bacterium]
MTHYTRTADAGIACLTRENYSNPWILFEAGLIIDDNNHGFYPFLLDMKPDDLDGLNYPLYLCESYTFEKKRIWEIVKALNKKLNLSEKQIKKAFDSSWAKLKSDLNPIAKNVPFFSYLLTPERYKVQRTPQWESLYLTIVAKRIKESPFKFADLLAEARGEIFVSGQNLYSLTATDKKKENTTNKKLIFEAIKKKKVRIMLCDPANACAIKTWGEDVMRDKELFAEHLAHSITTLTKWVKELRTNKIVKGRKKFEVKTTGMVPLSITFVDPSSKTNSGKLIITTATYERKGAETRPCYLILQKEHPDIFQYYFEAYNWTYKENAKELK